MNTQHILNTRQIAEGTRVRESLVGILKEYAETSKQLREIEPEVAKWFQGENDPTMHQVSRTISAIDHAFDAKTPIEQFATTYVLRHELTLLDDMLGMTTMQMSMVNDVLQADVSIEQRPGICEIRFSYGD
jgi:hypothetical protein